MSSGGSKKDQQEGRVKQAILPTTPHTTADTAGKGAAETHAEGSDEWKKQFPQANAAGASRDEYQQSADARRIQAERAANLAAKRDSERNGDPVPTGEGENPHEGGDNVDPDGVVKNPEGQQKG
jgi:hypothetical protein